MRYLCRKSEAMIKNLRLYILPAFFIITQMMYLNTLSAGVFLTVHEIAVPDSTYLTEFSDTVPELPPDTILPVQIQDTIAETDTIISEIDFPETDTLTITIESELPLDIDTIQAETQPIPSPTVTSPPVQQERTRTYRTVFDRNKAYWVEWDASLTFPDSLVLTRVFSAREKYGAHFLEPTSIQPEPQSISKSLSRDLITLLIILSISLIGITRFLFPLRFKENLIAGFSGRHFNHLEREGGLMNNWASFFMLLNFLLVFSLLIFLSLENWGYNHILNDTPLLLSLGYIIIGIILFYVAKYIVVFFISWVFKTQTASESYFLNISLINQSAGLILLPVLVISIYNPDLNLIFPAWIIYILLNLFKIIRGAYLGYKSLDFSAYYLILYLCAIEFAPLILIVKLTRNALLS